jgi:hypothetical protein
LVAARAEAPIIEAMQWKHPDKKAFYLGVQVYTRKHDDHQMIRIA